MKKLCIILLLLGLNTSIFSQTQTEEPATYKNEIGVDITTLLSNIFGWGQNYYVYDYYPYNYYYGYANSYLFSYKRHFNSSAIRFGMNANMMSSNAGDNVYTVDNIYRMTRMDFRLGYEWETMVGKKIEIYYGVDAVMHTYNYTSDVDYVDDTTSDYKSISSASSLGGGPLVGISWYVLPRLKLSTDASLQFISTGNNYEYEYSNMPEQNTKSSTTVTEFKANYPMFLDIEFLF